MKCKDTEDNNGIDFINIEGFAFFSTVIMSVRTSYGILEGCVLWIFRMTTYQGFFVTNNI